MDQAEKLRNMIKSQNEATPRQARVITVTSGKGGAIILKRANEVLEQEYPELAKKIALHIPDEKSRRVGQSVAAASLPRIK